MAAADHDDVGAEYRNPHRGRRIRTAITLLVLVVFVVGAAYYGVQTLQGDTGDDSAALPCEPPDVEGAPAAEEIPIRVLNGTNRGGLAGQIGDQLTDGGMNVVGVENYEGDLPTGGTALVLAGYEHDAAAKVVASMVPGAEITNIPRDDGQVDLVLGETFEAIGAPDPAAPTATDGASASGEC